MGGVLMMAEMSSKEFKPWNLFEFSWKKKQRRKSEVKTLVRSHALLSELEQKFPSWVCLRGVVSMMITFSNSKTKTKITTCAEVKHSLLCFTEEKNMELHTFWKTSDFCGGYTGGLKVCLRSRINLTSWPDAGVLMSHNVGTLGAMSSVLRKLETAYSDKESFGEERIDRSSRQGRSWRNRDTWWIYFTTPGTSWGIKDN